MDKIRISSKLIGKDQPTFIIAEAGINHNGDIRIAKKLVNYAKNAGADAIKFQTFKTENLVTKSLDLVGYQIKNIKHKNSQYNMLKSLELTNSEFNSIKNYCDKKDIIFLSTPHSYDAIDFLEYLVPAYKIGSGDITNIPALKHIAKKGKPVILGTGMSTIKEVKNAIEIMKSIGNKQIIALHCTTNYPCPINQVNLNAMITMKKELGCIIGYSDHTLGIIVPIIATAIGAKVIEKHLTIDKKLPGPDHKSSLNPEELKSMISKIRETEIILGNFNKKPTKDEEKIKKLIRKSLVAKKDIKKGTKINRDMIEIKRPATGIIPSDVDKIIGKKTKINIRKDEVINYRMIE
jgi:N-acetylneuraminate synthase/N,N'-diacetyllegionaminate synthase